MKTHIILLLCFTFWGLVGCVPASDVSINQDPSEVNRNIEFVYLSSTESPTEIYKYSISSDFSTQLTNTNGKVVDYAVNYQSGDIAFSVINNQGGLDIWFLAFPYGEAKQIISCGSDTCFLPQFSTENSLLMYQKGIYPFESTSLSANTQIRFIDLNSFENRVLFGSEINNGINASWSPDGKYLAYYQTNPAGIRILDLLGNEVTLLQGFDIQNTFTWDGNSDYFYILFHEISNDRPATMLQRIRIPAMDIQRIEIGLDEKELVTGLRMSLTENQLVLGVRHSALLSNQKLVVYNLDSNKIVDQIGEPTVSMGNYSWHANGNLILFQQYSFQSPNDKPKIEIWDLQKNSVETYISDAYSPKFLP